MATLPTFVAGQPLTAAQMNTIGVYKISTVTASGAATIVANSVFTSDYTNYLIECTGLLASAGLPALTMRLRASGTDNSGAVYYAGYNYSTWTGATAGFGDNGATSWGFLFVNTTTASAARIELYRPQQAATTDLIVQCHAPDSARHGSGYHNSSSQFDGFSIIPASGTLSGTVTIYGWRP